MRVLKLILKQFHCLKKATINFCRIKVAAKHSTEFPNEKQLLLIFFRRFQFSTVLDGAGGSGRNKNAKPELRRRRRIIFFSFGTLPPPPWERSYVRRRRRRGEDVSCLTPRLRRRLTQKSAYISLQRAGAGTLPGNPRRGGGGIFSPFWLRLTFTRKWRERFDGSYYYSILFCLLHFEGNFTGQRKYIQCI